MSLSATVTPSGKALVGNPIKLSVSTDGQATYAVAIGSDVVFTGSGRGNFFVFLNEVILPHIVPQLCSNDDSRMLIPLTGQSVDVTVTVNDDDGSSPVVRSITVFYGGISKQSQRLLGSTNIFTARFLAQTNFFFTSRGDSSRIAMKDTELSPLPLLVPADLQVKHGNDSLTITGTAGAFAALNIAKLMSDWFTNYGYYPDSIDIYGNGGKACTLQFDQTMVTKDRYLVRFLDSLGCYSIIEFCGTARQGIDEVDDGTYECYDDITDSYQQLRNRIETRGVVSMNTGYKTEDELLYLQELLRSEDVTLLDYQGQDRKVTATCDGYEVAIASFEPGNLLFEFHFSDVE